MSIIFTKEFLNKKRQEYGLPKLKYIGDVQLYSLFDCEDTGRHCYHGFIESETDEYNQFITGFVINDNDYTVYFDKTKYGPYNKKTMEERSKNLYPGFSKDFIQLYNDKIKNEKLKEIEV